MAGATWNCCHTGVNGYRNKSQHRNLTLEKKILPLLLPRLKPTTFQSHPSPALISLVQFKVFSVHSWKPIYITYIYICVLNTSHDRMFPLSLKQFQCSPNWHVLFLTVADNNPQTVLVSVTTEYQLFYSWLLLYSASIIWSWAELSLHNNNNESYRIYVVQNLVWHSCRTILSAPTLPCTYTVQP